MKKLIVYVALSLGVVAPTLHADVTIDLDAGILRTAAGVGFEPIGGLLQIIATRSGSASNFGTPTVGAFTTGTDNFVVRNFAMNYAFGSGETLNTISFALENTGTASPTAFDAGDPLLLRWWPSITLVGGAPSRTPQATDTYGQFRSNSGEGGGIAWFTPSDGTTLVNPSGLNFLTSETTDFTGAPGTHLPIEGWANIPVNPVPEPTTYALLGLGLSGLTFGFMRRRRQEQLTVGA